MGPFGEMARPGGTRVRVRLGPILGVGFGTIGCLAHHPQYMDSMHIPYMGIIHRSPYTLGLMALSRDEARHRSSNMGSNMGSDLRPSQWVGTHLGSNLGSIWGPLKSGYLQVLESWDLRAPR